MKPRIHALTLIVFGLAQVGLAHPHQDDNQERAERPRRPPPPAVIMENDDLDRDGALTVDEFRGPERHFEQIDADQDGLVTLAELENHRPPCRKRGGKRDRNPESPSRE